MTGVLFRSSLVVGLFRLLSAVDIVPRESGTVVSAFLFRVIGKVSMFEYSEEELLDQRCNCAI